MSAEMEHLIKEFENFQSKIKQAEMKFSGVAQMQEELSELESRVTSPDRTVTVVAGPGGAIKDIRVSQEGMRQQASALSATIMQTVQQAVADAARKQAGIVEQHMGGLSGGIGEQVLQAQAEAFGTTIEDLQSNTAQTPVEPVQRMAPPPPPPAAPAASPPPPSRPAAPTRRPIDDDEEDGFGSVFEGGR